MNTSETIFALAVRLSRENAALRGRVDAAALQLAGLEEHIFSVERALAQPLSDDDASHSLAREPQAQDIEQLTRENVSLHARLDYCAQVVGEMEESLLQMSDIMQRI